MRKDVVEGWLLDGRFGQFIARRSEKAWSAVRTKYRLTDTEIHVIFMRQRGACFLCEREDSDKSPLFFDHDWGTGKVRGLLCNSCNSGLSTVERFGIEKVAKYLKRGL